MSVASTDARSKERRGKRDPIPTHIRDYLNQEQLLALNKIENFGWQLAFIRQPLFEPSLAVIVSPDKLKHAVLKIDGEINMHPDIVVRH